MKKLLCALCAMTLLATATGCSNNNADKDKKETSGNTLVVASNNIDAKSQPDVDAQRNYWKKTVLRFSAFKKSIT